MTKATTRFSVAVDRAMSQRRNVKAVVSAAETFIADSDIETAQELTNAVQTFLRQKFDDELTVGYKIEDDDILTIMIVYGRRDVETKQNYKGVPQWLN